jgi:hypothetical protein
MKKGRDFVDEKEGFAFGKFKKRLRVGWFGLIKLSMC